MRNEQQEGQIVKTKSADAELLVQLFKFYIQEYNPYVRWKVDFRNIKTTSMYKRNKRHFDRLLNIINRFKINHDTYIRFCVKEMGVRKPIDLLNVNNFKLYAERIKEDEQYRLIYEYYMKSANNIADECIRLKTTPVKYLKSLIVENRLAYEYTTGAISKYFLASIQNFKQIYGRLDELNRTEMSIIYNATDELNRLAQNAFIRMRGCSVRPLALTEQIISQKQQNTKTN